MTKKAQLAVDAKLKVALAGQLECNPRYQTVFQGMKRDHSGAAAIAYPFFFLLRRIAYAAIIVFLYPFPFFAALALIALTLFISAYVLI